MFDIEKSLGYLLSKTYRRAFTMFKSELDRYALTPPQFGLLAFLWKQDGLSQAELAEKTHIDRTTIGGLIDRLTRQLLVIRMPQPDDRRSYRICLTDKGKALEGELSAIAMNVTEKFTAVLTDQERAHLAELLEKLRR